MGVSKDPSCSGKGRNRYGFVLCRIRLFQQHYRAWDVPAWLYSRCRRVSNHPLFSRTQILIAFPTECFSCLSGIFFCQRVKFIRLFEPNARGGVTIFLQLILASRVILLKMTFCLLGRCSPIPANAEQALRLSGTVRPKKQKIRRCWRRRDIGACLSARFGRRATFLFLQSARRWQWYPCSF